MVLVNHIKYFLKANNRVSIIFALLMTWPILGPLPYMPEIVRYLLLITFCIYSLSSVKNVNTTYIVFFIYLVLNIILTQPPTYFKSWERLALFVVLLLSVAPVTQSSKNRWIRKSIFNTIILLCVIISVASFFCWFLGINYMQLYYDTGFVDLSGGIFGGLTTQSMMLGPISGISVVYLLFRYLKSREKLLIFLLVCSLGSLVFTASRSAFLATISGCLILLTKLYKGKISELLKNALLLTFVVIVTAPLWFGYIESGLLKKNQGQTDSIEMGSRQDLWEDRIEEFESNPFFGVGFASMSDEHASLFTRSTGVVEPGSSWLAVLSMTGILGATFMLIIMLQVLNNSWKSDHLLSSLLFSLLVMFIVHMIAEGYIFAGGGFLCFCLWLVIGQAYDIKFDLD